MRLTAPEANQIVVSTRCRSVEQFIGTFHRFTAPESIFVSTLIDRPSGFAIGFSFALADGTPVLRGTGVVLEKWNTVDNPFKLPGFTLGIKWLSPRSAAVFHQMQRRSAFGSQTAPPIATLPPAPPAGSGELARATPVETSARGSPGHSRRWMVDVALISAATGFMVLDRTTAAPEASSTTVAAIPSRDEGPPVVGDGPCRLVVSSTPTGSIVALDGVTQGESPITIATSCGRHRVEVSEQRHQTLAAWVTLAIEQTERIDVPLTRPIHAVAVTTRPSGAAIYIDGSPAGTTPTMLNVLGHVPITIEIKKAGYQPLIQHLYSTNPLDKLAIQMIKAPPRRP